MTTTTPDITIVAALTRDNALGHNGQLIHHLRPDMRHFRTVTTGHPIIMGRHTYNTLPNGPLPNRRNIVVSRNPEFRPDGIEVYPTIDDAINAAANDNTEIMIIGGGQIYAQTIDRATHMYLTQFDTTAPHADTRFPDIDPDQWTTTQADQWQTDPETQVRYRFICLTRR